MSECDLARQAGGRAGWRRSYARVSSERQRQDETIQSQTVGLRELATAARAAGHGGSGVRGRGVLRAKPAAPGA